MRKFILFLALALGVLSPAALAATSASASTTYTAVTSLTNRPDSGNNANNGGNWAIDTLTRTATLIDLGTDPHAPGFDTYSFSLSDTGTYVADAGVASNPNGLNPLTLIGTSNGTVKGTGTWTNFDVPSTVHPNPADVPTNQDGVGTSSSKWLAYFFHGVNPTLCPGTGLDSADTVDTCGQEATFSYLYTSCSEHWLDANTDADGNAKGVTDTTDLATIGGISGAACPPAPTPTPSQSSSTPPPAPTGTTSGGGSGVPSGAPQTGGGEMPSANPAGPITGVVLLTIGLGLAFGLARKASRNH